jgi:prevent-host-death family protein
MVLTSNDKGNIAEAAIALEAIKLGIDVLKPVAEHGRYDLAFDMGARILRVQCKWAPLKGDVISVQLGGYRLTTRGAVRTTYDEDEIDAVAVYCQALDRVYVLPADVVARRHSIQLRVGPTKNAQRAALNWARKYSLGAIAQSGERLRGTQEVAGSSPASSIPPIADETTVGAHQFRNHFGYWMERAASGAEVLITRRGRRYARLGPADPPLGLAAEADRSQ